MKEYNLFTKSCKHEDHSDRYNTVEAATLITKSISAIKRITGNKSEYYKSIQIAYATENRRQYSHGGLIIKHIIGIIKALKDDLENNYLKSISEIIHSNLFSDYIDMSSHLLEEGYKDPAAVLTGSTLESHLRSLCLKHDIDVEHENREGKIISKKADTMNAELAKNNIYNQASQKQITAWVGLRNNAAHDRYNQYSDTEVKLMILGVLNFIQSYPA